MNSILLTKTNSIMQKPNGSKSVELTYYRLISILMKRAESYLGTLTMIIMVS